MVKKIKPKKDKDGRFILNKTKQPQKNAEKMTIEERLLRLEIALGIVAG